jgi:hypothetical protein
MLAKQTGLTRGQVSVKFINCTVWVLPFYMFLLLGRVIGLTATIQWFVKM